MDYVILLAGLVLLLFGGDLLVKGAVGISLKWKISPMIVGLTVVSFGTSAPELLVSLKASIGGHGDLAIGNVIGSNIANLALVLGLTALIIKIPVSRSTIRVDWPVMMLSSLMLWYFISDGLLQYYEGIILVIMLFGYLFGLIAKARSDKKKGQVELPEEDGSKSYLIYLALLVLGIFGLIYGAQWMVKGATEIAKSFNVSEYVIGVTVIAFGTSLPELATSVIAASKGRTDISVGNLIGSNIFNILAVLGITASITDIHIAEQVLKEDVFWFLGVALVILPMMLFDKVIGKISGALLLLTYVLYIYFVL